MSAGAGPEPERPPDVTHVNNQGGQWDPSIDPESWKNSWANPHLVDDPPGYAGPAGPARDWAWRDYLRNFPAGPGPRGFLPRPDAVGDPGLRVVANAATQLGISFAWGGGTPHGPSQGVVGDLREDGSPDPADGANTYQDHGRIGFDCSGLAQYSVARATGLDIGKYTGDQIESPHLTALGPGDTPEPGDMLYFGTQPHHVAIYIAPGVVINARQSGQPVQLEHRNTTASTDSVPPIRIWRILD